MIDASAALAMAVIALGLVLTPGPNMVYLVSRSVTQGRRAGLVSLAGVAAGFGVHLALAAAGLAVVLVAVPAAYTTLKVAGALYLAYLAWQVLRPGGRSAFEVRQLSRDSRRRLFTMGLVTNVLNPKIAVLYVTLLPQLVDPSRGSVARQSLALGAVQICVALVVNTFIVLTAGSLAAFLSERPRWLHLQRWVMGTVLGGLAAHLALDRARPAAA